ncbi:hypothetical protein Lesp02_54930 [Lentzea sp. NBRC 105346]|uniref:SAM-dependent methyltransferase n=1 Tax=Lentzea sp. NBRC 105346 TaxID=3032205 RepID=UPI0024A30775|nr:SAM-dependent methyltransferase [Lentzea sp. NBRC 105346]GLZ33305.1 hypothetical protein Lesp02_54930 [Lentzea sp. NBRC 105346]
MERPNWAPGDIDLERPSVARVYDYWLGGAHNFAADRAVAQRALDTMPDLRRVIVSHRAFLRRAVRFLLEQGVRQFLDLGSGIPTVGNVHEIAQDGDPDSKVVYVDIDPVAVAHSRSLLLGNDRVSVLQADVRDGAYVMKSPEVTDLFDLERPVGVLMIALLHFVPDSDDPLGILATYLDALPSGSYLAISHAGYEEGEDGEGWTATRNMYDRNVTPMTYRNREQFTRLFAGLELVDPGVVRLPLWRPESLEDVDDTGAPFPVFGAVGRKA